MFRMTSHSHADNMYTDYCPRTTALSHTKPILSSIPLVPSGIRVKSSFPIAFWEVLCVQWALPTAWRSPLYRKKQIMSTAWTNCTSSRIVPAAVLKFPQALNTGGSVFAVSLSASAGVDFQTWKNAKQLFLPQATRCLHWACELNCKSCSCLELKTQPAIWTRDSGATQLQYQPLKPD